MTQRIMPYHALATQTLLISRMNSLLFVVFSLDLLTRRNIGLLNVTSHLVLSKYLKKSFWLPLILYFLLSFLPDVFFLLLL